MNARATHAVIPAILTTVMVAGAWAYIRLRPLPELPPPPSSAPALPARQYSLKKEFGPGIRCAAPSTSAVDTQDVALQAELYRLIIESSPHVDVSSPLPVEALSIPLRGFPGPPPRGAGTETWPSSIIALARAGIGCVLLRAEALPARAQLVPLAQLSPPEYPNQFFGFSQVIVDDRKIDALVYYERHCRACGVGEFVWFHRDAPADAWQIAGRRWGWIN